jgi:Ca-activated chloride channel homolog
MMRARLAAALVLSLALWAGVAGRAQDPAKPVFRAGVARVTLNVVVRDERGRPVTGLRLADFQVLDEGEPVAISDFRADGQPISVAVLADTSGSIRLADRLSLTKQAGQALLGALRPDDEAALFTFDRNLHALAPFSADLSQVRAGLDRIVPFGSTALHDAVAATAQRSVERPSSRRAVVVITDGIDTSSDLSAAMASSIASSIDVPIYILGVDGPAPPLVGSEAGKISDVEIMSRLDYLARWSGGAFLPAATKASTQIAVDQIVSDLRSGYLMAFAPREQPGWHRITVKVSRRNVTVQTRGGFWVGPRLTFPSPFRSATPGTRSAPTSARPRAAAGG